MDEYELKDKPEDWEMIPLGKCVISITDSCDPSLIDGQPYLGLEHLSSGLPFIVGKGKPEDVRSAKTMFFKYDVLYGKLRPYLRKAVLAPFEGICSTDIIVMRAGEQIIPEYLTFLLHSAHFVNQAMATTSGVNHPRTSWSKLKPFVIPVPPLPEQRRIAAVLSAVQRAIEQQEELIARTTELKKTLMHKLFTEGTRGEPQKETEIGPVPESWEIVRLGDYCKVMSSSTPFKQINNLDMGNTLFNRVLALKVSDMTLEGNERIINHAKIEFYPDPKKFEVSNKTIPQNAIIFPKRGAAIATNKKRLLGQPAILDPNLIAVVPVMEFVAEFLFCHFEQIDLKIFTEPGCLPQLNKKNLEPAMLPKPEMEEQLEITQMVEHVDDKISQAVVHFQVLQDLFHTLLHQLMTAEIRVNEVDLSELREIGIVVD